MAASVGPHLDRLCPFGIPLCTLFPSISLLHQARPFLLPNIDWRFDINWRFRTRRRGACFQRNARFRRTSRRSSSCTSSRWSCSCWSSCSSGSSRLSSGRRGLWRHGREWVFKVAVSQILDLADSTIDFTEGEGTGSNARYSHVLTA